MSSWPRPICGRKRCVKVCIKCCVCESEGWYKIKVPSKPIAVVASRSGNQAYTSTATTVIFNTVTLNETIRDYAGCGSCNSNPCCCKKKKKRCGCGSDPCSCKKKKKRCDKDCVSYSNSCGPSSCSSGCPPYNPCPSPCPPYPCPPYPCNPCNPYPPMPLYQPGGYNPYYGWCMFYDSTTGIATVPVGGGGYYMMAASLTTDSVTGFTAELRINGAVIDSKVVPAGQTQAMLMGNQEVYDYQQISVVVYGATPANVTAGNLAISRVA